MSTEVRAGESPGIGDTTVIAHQAVLQPGTGVLLVGDDRSTLEFLQTQVAAAGYAVATAVSGEAALTMLVTEFRPIVIIDRKLPDMDGLTLCRTLRERTWPGYLYALLLTAQDAEEDVLQGLDAGADDYLSKQTSVPQLLARLRTAQRILGLEQALRSLAEERKRIAMTDSLTGAASRRYLMRYLEREIQRSMRYDENLAVLAVDVDHFKRINDTYGHATGDAVLVELVQRIRTALPREYDWCARLGGEEFIVVLPQTSIDGATVVAERVREGVAARPMTVGAASLDVTVSIGVATLAALAGSGSPEVDPLLALADEGLYCSKLSGRNRVTAGSLATVSAGGRAGTRR
jgi:two-component system, cell cycle response regulator